MKLNSFTEKQLEFQAKKLEKQFIIYFTLKMELQMWKIVKVIKKLHWNLEDELRGTEN
jgi:hypothetical protein